MGTDAGLSPQDLLSLFHECAVNGAPGLLSAARLGQALQLYLAVMNCWSQVDSADGGEDAQLATWVKAVDARCGTVERGRVGRWVDLGVGSTGHGACL